MKAKALALLRRAALLMALVAVLAAFSGCGNVSVGDVLDAAVAIAEILESEEPGELSVPAETPEATPSAAADAVPSAMPSPAISVKPFPTAVPTATPAEGDELDEYGSYDSKDEVALYIHTYGRLPDNYITKDEARALGWGGGSVEKYAPGKCIGGDRFGNYEGKLPKKDGRKYTECDIDTLGESSRGAKRIIFSNDGLIFYTGDHYESFTQLY